VLESLVLQCLSDKQRIHEAGSRAPFQLPLVERDGSVASDEGHDVNLGLVTHLLGWSIPDFA
jgi:hypothetical protein